MKFERIIFQRSLTCNSKKTYRCLGIVLKTDTAAWMNCADCEEYAVAKKENMC